MSVILSSGYDAMGYAMSKPYLRAQLEADLRKLVTQVSLCLVSIFHAAAVIMSLVLSHNVHCAAACVTSLAMVAVSFVKCCTHNILMLCS